MSNEELLEALRSFSRKHTGTRSLEIVEKGGETESEEFEEVLIDDRPDQEISLEQLFQEFETGETDGELFDSRSMEMLENLIPQRDTQAETFEEFFNNLGITHFQAHELLRMGGNNASGPCKGKNRHPAKTLWPNIVMTISALDEVRDRLGYGINTLSVYRHKPYNDCLRTISSGVAKHSQHLEFRAIDFRGASGTPSDWYAEVRKLSNEHPEYGIWTKRYNSFVHIDTRGVA